MQLRIYIQRFDTGCPRWVELLWQQELKKYSKEGSEQLMIFCTIFMTLWCHFKNHTETQYARSLSMEQWQKDTPGWIPRTWNCFVSLTTVLVLQEWSLAMCVPRSLKTGAHDVSDMIQQTSLSSELIKPGICCCFFIRHQTWSYARTKDEGGLSSTLNHKDVGIYERQIENSHKHTHTHYQQWLVCFLSHKKQEKISRWAGFINPYFWETS